MSITPSHRINPWCSAPVPDRAGGRRMSSGFLVPEKLDTVSRPTPLAQREAVHLPERGPLLALRLGRRRPGRRHRRLPPRSLSFDAQ
jgi:hypothetical protein